MIKSLLIPAFMRSSPGCLADPQAGLKAAPMLQYFAKCCHKTCFQLHCGMLHGAKPRFMVSPELICTIISQSMQALAHIDQMQFPACLLAQCWPQGKLIMCNICPGHSQLRHFASLDDGCRGDCHAVQQVWRWAPAL